MFLLFLLSNNTSKFQKILEEIILIFLSQKRIEDQEEKQIHALKDFKPNE